MITFKLKDRAQRIPVITNHASLFTFAQKESEEVYREFGHFVYCRDYLGEYLWSHLNGNVDSPSSGRKSPKNDPIDSDKTRLAILLGKNSRVLTKNFHILNQIERNNNFEESILLETDNLRIVVVEGDPIWMTALWALSTYSFILRCLAELPEEVTHENWMEKLPKSPEKDYLTFFQVPRFKKFLTLLSKIPLPEEVANGKDSTNNIYSTGWTKNNTNAFFLHGYSGFMSIGSPDLSPYDYCYNNRLPSDTNIYRNRVRELMAEGDEFVSAA